MGVVWQDLGAWTTERVRYSSGSIGGGYLRLREVVVKKLQLSNLE